MTMKLGSTSERSRKLLSVALSKPWRWLVTYLAAVLLFGWIFLSLGPGNFAQTNAGAERSSFRQLEQETVDLVLASLDVSMANGDSGVLREAGLTVPPSLLRVAAIDADSQFLRFRVVGTVVDWSGAEPVSYGPAAFSADLVVDPRPDFELLPDFAVVSIKNDQSFEFHDSVPTSLEVRWEDILIRIGELQGTARYENEGELIEAEYIVVDDFQPTLGFVGDEVGRLADLHAAIFLGDPTVMSHSKTRMLYFSATTITTLGLGDIVPVSTAARAWTLAETVVGVILIGLFLNDLSSIIAGRAP